jgi:hypothetical protein
MRRIHYHRLTPSPCCCSVTRHSSFKEFLRTIKNPTPPCFTLRSGISARISIDKVGSAALQGFDIGVVQRIFLLLQLPLEFFGVDAFGYVETVNIPAVLRTLTLPSVRAAVDGVVSARC